jgi:hypothetical protein
VRRLRRALATVRLGIRLIRARRRSLVPAMATLLAAAVSVLVVLGVAAAASVARTQIARVGARLPVAAEPDRVEEDAPLVHYAPEPYGKEVIERFSVALRGGVAPVPPGIERLPRPGEMFASPALAARLETDPLVRTMFPHRLAGLISPEGLRGPGELVAWAGYRPERLLASDEDVRWMSVRGFGQRDIGDLIQGYELLQPGYFVYYGAGLAILVLVPLALVAGGAARLSSRLRERRLVALRTLGLSPSRTVAVAAVEAAVVSGTGTLLALVAAPVVRGLVGSGPVFGEDFFPGDVRVGVATIAAAAAGVPAFVTVVAGVAASRVMRKPPTTRPSVAPIPVRRSATALLVAGGFGLAAVAWPLSRVLSPLHAVLLFYAATLAFAAGLAIGLPAVVQRLAGWAASRSRGTTALLAWRRLAADPGPPTRLLAPGCALMFAAIAFLPLFGVLSGDPDWIADLEARKVRGGRQLLHVEGVPTGVDVTALAGQSGVRAVIPVASAHDSATAEYAVDVYVATCEQIRALAVRPVECPETVWEIRTAGMREPLGRRSSLILRLVDGEEVRFPRVTQGRDLGLHLLDNVGGLVLPPGTIAEGTEVTVSDYLGVLAPTPQAVAEFRAGVAALAPAAGFLDYYSLQGELRFLPLLRYLLALLTVGVALTVVAFLVAGLDLGIERGRALAPLRVLGAPPEVLKRSQAMVIAAPGLVGVAVASAAGLLAAQAFVAIRGTELRDMPTVAALAAVGILFTLAASAGGAIGIGRSKGSEITLRE